ncbi:hypothetical protein IAT40_004915 [Kwoniella sp. CBS 6097]
MRIKTEKSDNDRAVEEYFKNDSEQEMFPPSSDESSENEGCPSQTPNARNTSTSASNKTKKVIGRKRKAPEGEEEEGDEYEPDLDLVKIENENDSDFDSQPEDRNKYNANDDNDDDVKPDISNSKKPKRSSPVKSQAKAKSASSRKGYAAPRAWSGEEDWQLFRSSSVFILRSVNLIGMGSPTPLAIRGMQR